MSEAAELKQPLTMADIINQMKAVREERRELSARDKELVADWRALEAELMHQLDEQGMTKASSIVGTATITETILPNVVDWDAFYGYIKEEDAFHLLQRSPTAAAFREMNSSGQQVPGVEPYTQRKISLRKK